jgi:hypothetical protein
MRRPYVIDLPGGPRRLLDLWGPLIVGVFPDAPESVKAEWL